MSGYVTDTHAFIWHLTADVRLGDECRTIFEAADRGEAHIAVPAIVLVEAVYLVEKARFPIELVERMLKLVDPPSTGYGVAPLDAAVVRALTQIPRAIVPDLPDRVIAATALRLRVPLLSKDEKIRGLQELTFIW